MYVVGIILGRMNRRFIGRRTVANFFLFVFIGSVLAAAIIGDLFYEILGMAIAIIIKNDLKTPRLFKPGDERSSFV